MRRLCFLPPAAGAWDLSRRPSGESLRPWANRTPAKSAHIKSQRPVAATAASGATDDGSFMLRALELATQAAGQTRPNPMVGCVIVHSDTRRILGEGFHPRAGEPHAEVFALRAAGHRAKGATAYVTLEPCNHYGRTPPCSDALIQAGVSRVVIGMVDPDPRTCGGGVAKLRAAGIHVDVGVMNRECATVNEGFSFRIRSGRPFGTLKYAMTLDGKIATDSGSSRWVSGSESRHYVHQLRARTDAIIIGGNTLRKDNPSLDVRLPSETNREIHPLRVVLTKSIELLPLDSKLFDTSALETVVITDTDSAAGGRANDIRSCGVKVVGVDDLGPRAALDYLHDRGALNVLWECGGKLAAEALREGCVQRVVAFIAPKLVGGGPDAYTPLSYLGIDSMKSAMNLTDTNIQTLGTDVMVSGLVTRQ